MALARDTPEIAPVHLDFDGSSAPKNCNDRKTFRALLSNWLLPNVLSNDAERQLVVRIRRSPTGGKLADVKLTDAGGATLGEHHERYGSQSECHMVLYETALASAKLLGTSPKPPPPEPCPICAACPSCPVCPACPPPTLPLPQPTALRVPRFVLPPVRRAFFGAGVFLGSGLTPVGMLGPHFAFGFVLSAKMPRVQLEIDGAYARQVIPMSNGAEVLHVHTTPIFSAFCYARYVLRICSGLTTTFFQAQPRTNLPGSDAFRVTLAGHLRVGTEFDIAGPLSMRVDGYMQVRFGQRTYGQELAALDAPNHFNAGASAMGVWSFE